MMYSKEDMVKVLSIVKEFLENLSDMIDHNQSVKDSLEMALSYLSTAIKKVEAK